MYDGMVLRSPQWRAFGKTTQDRHQ
jgi:hypothetical protein